MSTVSEPTTIDIAEPVSRPSRRWRFAAALLAVVIAGGVAVLVVDPFASGPNGTPVSTTGTALAEVEQRSLSAQTQVSGTLGYAGDFDVVNQANGTITALPSIGQVVKQGEALYQVDGSPVVLLYGSTPAYRELAVGAYASDVKGSDVQQLNAALVALGHATTSELDPNSDQFTWATAQVVKKLQAALGISQTGALNLGQVVFLPTAVRVTSVLATLGAPSQPGAALLEATSTTPVVSVNLDAARQTQVKQGDTVTITLPNLTKTQGTVSSVGTVATTSSSSSPGGAGDGGDPTIPVEITLSDAAAAGGLDQAPVLVSITTATADNVLVVPVTALLALAGGGYAVEIVGDDGVHKLVPVSLGIFDDEAGVVEVSGTGLAAGQRVVVPAT